MFQKSRKVLFYSTPIPVPSIPLRLELEMQYGAEAAKKWKASLQEEPGVVPGVLAGAILQSTCMDEVPPWPLT